MFPLPGSAQPWHGRAVPALRLRADIPPFSQHRAELRETCAVSAAAAVPEELIYLPRTQTSALPGPTFPSEGVGVQELLQVCSPGVPIGAVCEAVGAPGEHIT